MEAARKYEWKKLLTRGMLLLFALCVAVNGYLFYTSQSLYFNNVFNGDYASYLEGLEQLQENPDMAMRQPAEGEFLSSSETI